jgi:hypothetical protein
VVQHRRIKSVGRQPGLPLMRRSTANGVPVIRVWRGLLGGGRQPQLEPQPGHRHAAAAGEHLGLAVECLAIVDRHFVAEGCARGRASS